MKKMTPTVLLLSAILSFPIFADEAKQYIGEINPRVPSDCEDRGGAVIGGHLSKDWRLGWHRFDCRTASMFWLQELVSQSPLQWRIIDVLRIVHPRDGRTVLIDDDGCNSLSETGFVIAVGKWVNREPGGYAKDISQAWIVSDTLTDKRFRPLSVTDVKCEYSEDRD